LKGKAEVLEHASVKVDLKREWASHWPFAPTDHKSSFTPQRVAIENSNGQVIEELLNPRESFKGYEMETPWSNPQVQVQGGRYDDAGLGCLCGNKIVTLRFSLSS
jgi:hypothetical protein